MNQLPTTTALLLLLLTGCNSTTQQQSQASKDSLYAQTVVISAPPADSLSLDLLTLKAQGKLTDVQTVRVADDPVFHSAKTYRGIPLLRVLERYTSLKNLDVAQTQIVFECEDGYNPSMPLSIVLGRHSYLAVSDADAPNGKEWVDAVKNGKTKKIAPFYVVYSDVKADERNYKWPYNLVKISLVQTAKIYATVYPHNDDTMVKGFGLFYKNCGICHALNGVGGKMGPELNYPKSITEYWRDVADIKAFVKAPTSFRHDCKMPAVTYLSDRELDEIVRYLTFMATHKTQPQPSSQPAPSA